MGAVSSGCDRKKRLVSFAEKTYKMARGQQKIQSQEKNAKKKEAAKKVWGGHDLDWGIGPELERCYHLL